MRQSILEHVRPDWVILDLGAGAGILPHMNFRGVVARVCGVDLDPRVTPDPMLDEGRVATTGGTCAMPPAKRLLHLAPYLVLAISFFSRPGMAQDTPGATAQAVTPSTATELSAVPVAEGIELRWPAMDGSDSIARLYRWSEGGAPAVIAREITGQRFLDRTAELNRIYLYRIEGAAGRVTNKAVGVRSDIHRTFQCPAHPALAATMLGRDRTETFTTPSGSTVRFTIRAPEPRATVIAVAPCNGRAQCSDHAAIADAVAKAVKAGGGTIRLGEGTFQLRPPADSKAYAQIEINGARDIVLTGAPPQNGLPRTVIQFDAEPHLGAKPGLMQGLSTADGRRLLIKDLAFDWDRPLAMPGTIVNAGTTEQHFVVDDPDYYIPDPAHPPEIVIINSYDRANRTYVFEPRGRIGFAPGKVVFNPNFATDRTYHYVIKGQPLPNGRSVIGIARTGAVVHVGGGSQDISFEGVHLWGGGGAGFVLGPDGRGFRITDSKIIRKPDSLLRPGEKPRFISLRGDSDARNTRGEILIESSEFAMTEDDGFNIVGATVQGADGTEIVSDSEIKFVFKAWNPFAHPWSPEDTLLLLDPATYLPVAPKTALLASRTTEYDSATVTFTFRFKLAEPIPQLLAYQGRRLEELPFLADPRYASAPYVVRNSCLRDSSGGRLVAQSGPGLIEGNTIANVGGPGIELSANPYTWREGPGAIDVIVRNNTIVGAGYWLRDYDIFGGVEGRMTGWLAGAGITVTALTRTGFVAKGVPNRWLQITGNHVINTPGLGILVAAVGNANVSDNVIVNANSVPFIAGYDSAYCGAKSRGYERTGIGQPWCLARKAAQGALMITHADNVRSSNNRTYGTSDGVFTNWQTVD